MDEPKKIELIETVRRRWYWFVYDDIGGIAKSEYYQTERDAWQALFENKINWSHKALEALPRSKRRGKSDKKPGGGDEH